MALESNPGVVQSGWAHAPLPLYKPSTHITPFPRPYHYIYFKWKAYQYRLHALDELVSSWFNSSKKSSEKSGLSLISDPEGEQLWNVLKSEYPEIVRSCITSSQIPGKGRALTATQGIVIGQVLASMPLNAVISPYWTARDLNLIALMGEWKDGERKIAEWSMMAFWLSEMLCKSSNSETTGPLTLYVASLPHHTNGVLEWTDEEISMLKGSYLYSLAVHIKEATDASILELEDLVSAINVGKGMERPKELSILGMSSTERRKLFRKAFSILLSRLIRLDNALSNATSVEVLCPWMDFANHDCHSDAYIRYNPENDKVEMIARQKYFKGDEVCVSYGQKTNGELLLSYGFLPAKDTNPHDGCLLPFKLSESHPGYTWKSKFLETIDGSCSRLFLLKMTAIPVELERFATFAVAPVKNIEETQKLFENLIGYDDAQPPPLANKSRTSKLLLLGIRAVVEQCKAQLAEYLVKKGPVESLGVGPNQNELPRADLITQVILHEQRVLHRTIFIMEQRLQLLKKSK